MVKPFPFLCSVVGHAHQYGLGTAVNASKAIRLYRQAANGGLTAAHYHLGECYQAGFGVVKDDIAAFESFQ